MLTRLRNFLRRPVAWGAVILSYIGIMVALVFAGITSSNNDADIRHEADVRERDICTVIVNVNNNAKFRAQTEANRLENTKAYLRDTARFEDDNRDTDSGELRARVKATLPLIRADAKQAKANVTATAPPPTCVKYAKK